MAATNTLDEIMRGVGLRMKAQFETSKNLLHKGGKGEAREWIIREVIAPYLPARLAVTGSAEIISVDEQRSGQCDIVIYDRSLPPLLDTEGHRLLAAESVAIVIEVKSSLTRTELRKACAGIASVKRLPKKASFEGYDNAWFTPTAGMIFAFDGPAVTATAAGLREWAREHRLTEVPDRIFVMGKSLIFWNAPLEPDRLRAFPGQQPQIVAAHPPETDVSLSFISSVLAYVGRAQMPPFNFDMYAGSASLGVVHSQLPDCWDQGDYNEFLEVQHGRTGTAPSDHRSS